MCTCKYTRRQPNNTHTQKIHTHTTRGLLCSVVLSHTQTHTHECSELCRSKLHLVVYYLSVCAPSTRFGRTDTDTHYIYTLYSFGDAVVTHPRMCVCIKPNPYAITYDETHKNTCIYIRFCRSAIPCVCMCVCGITTAHTRAQHRNVVVRFAVCVCAYVFFC